MADTPNMGLTLPVVLTTLGPTWASTVNAALEEVDLHDHSSGKGVLVPTAGLNINAALSFGDYAAEDVGRVGLTNLGTALSSGDAQLFVYGGELYYRDASGNNVQITDGGVVDGAAAGSILGLVSPASATFTALTSQFGWYYDSGKQATMQMGDLQIFPFGPPTTYTNFITLKSPTTLASDPTYTLPAAAPASDSIIGMTSAGVMSAGAPAGAQATPSISFAADLNTGLWNPSADIIAVSTGGTERWRANSTAITATVPRYAPAGSLGAPSYSFTSDTDTGLYNSAANVLDLVTAGNRSLILTATTAQFSGVLLSPNGTEGAPSYAFTSDTDTGLWGNGSDVIAASTGGGVRLAIRSTILENYVPVGGTAGTVSAPAFTFSADTDTGIYQYGINQLGVAAGGSLGLYVASSGVQVATQLTFTGDSDTGLYSVGADTVGLMTNGSVRFSASTTGVTSTLPIFSPDGTAGGPGFSFTSDSDSGFYYGGSGAWYYSANGSNTVRLMANGLQANQILGINNSGNYLNLTTAGSTSLVDASAGTMISVSAGNDIILGNGTTDFGFALPAASLSGSAGALQGYMALFINGGAFKVPYYAI